MLVNHLVEIGAHLPSGLQLRPRRLDDLAHYVRVNVLHKMLHLVAQHRALVQSLPHLKTQFWRLEPDVPASADKVPLESHALPPTRRKGVRHPTQFPQKRESAVVLLHRGRREHYVERRVNHVVQQEHVPASLARRPLEDSDAKPVQRVLRTELGIRLPDGHVQRAHQLVPVAFAGVLVQVLLREIHEALDKVALPEQQEPA
mmetsp:Transcript_54574/g.152255  ORF Transcript_54574/g.152255 Transcript_54574/m.152255 type:complete len:202 (-) Transcript_54574:1759-2364(-)